MTYDEDDINSSTQRPAFGSLSSFLNPHIHELDKTIASYSSSSNSTNNTTTTLQPSFAQTQLEKYGWKAGDGLGRENNGITRAISVTKKNDTKGVGAQQDWGFQWWDHVFNKATAFIKVENDDDGELKVKTEENTQAQSTIKKKLLYGTFVKQSVDGNSSNSSSSNITPTGEKDYSSKISDEELLKACEGRTARKGARIDQPGKLLRADDGIVGRVVKEGVISGGSDERDIKKKKKEKKDKKKEVVVGVPPSPSTENGSDEKKDKKEKKEKKSKKDDAKTEDDKKEKKKDKKRKRDAEDEGGAKKKAKKSKKTDASLDKKQKKKKKDKKSKKIPV